MTEITLDDDYDTVDTETKDAEVEEMQQPFDPKKISIAVEPKTLDNLIKRLANNEIDMNTDFQRHADLWDNKKMSRLIESIMIRFPLPAFYFDASDEDKWLIVDGLQRLSSIRKFVVDKKLKLIGLEFLKDLNGKSYDELPRIYQRRIEEAIVTVYTIQPGTPDDVKYSVFRRINTGGLTLNYQEIRHALAKPRERELLAKLAKNPLMLELLGDQSKRMKDQELVLRFWAFFKLNYDEKGQRKEIVEFLDRAINAISKEDEEYHQEVEKYFILGLVRCENLLGKCAFQKDYSEDVKPKWVKSVALFEVLMVQLAKLEDKEFDCLLSKKDAFIKRYIELLKDNKFNMSISASTSKKEHVDTRHKELRKIIEETLNND